MAGDGPGRAESFTRERKQKYIEALADSGLKMHSARAVGVGFTTVREHRRRDTEFRAAEEEALELYKEAVQAEIDRRGRLGVEEPVYYKGEQVGTVRKYSDRLLALHAKRLIPEYRDSVSVDATVGGGVLVVGAVAATTEEWLQDARNAASAAGTYGPESVGEARQLMRPPGAASELIVDL